ncbi:MAG: 16S rRNA (uracil(1498)-N(3))-methyltransferase [Ruminococcaceae bacterium]|nr:16S rRNA (uracil(1498)-N(3))-methyltransferase [Oscillospiraceae bacterium]
MPRFFVRSDAICDDIITICGSDALHISRSLRMKTGDTVRVCDMQRTEYDCCITAFTSDTVTLRILSCHESQNEPPYLARLYMALPKGDKMELIIQKAVEMGVGEIIPFRSERSIVKLDDAAGEKKRQRWQKIADAAAGQCGRGAIPEVFAPLSLDAAIAHANSSELKFVCYEGEESFQLPALLSASPSVPHSVSFFIGAEGGFSTGEVEKFRAASIPSVGLGARILRCETAPLFVLSCLSYVWEISTES